MSGGGAGTQATADFAALDRLLCQALELPRAQRQQFAIDACGNDSARLAALQRLLDCCDDTDTDWQHLPEAYARSYADDLFDHGEMPPTLGAWRVLRPLGEGGMAQVVLAERQVEGARQYAAIKIMAAYRVSPDLLARFDREGRILASLSDPGIARFYDAGVLEDGRPWLAMEYVDGLRIDHYCDREKLSIEARLRLLIQVARAIASAHARLIVHRDIKPANVLVDAQGVVKVLDFGIAKILDDPTGEEDTRTAQRLLTLQYASPEQLLDERVDTASDVYQLGLMLYELCTGTRPFAEQEGSLPRMLRALSERDAPSMTRALDVGGGAVDQLAEKRATSALRLRRALSGDLQHIVAKALRRSPAERYSGVLQLLDDIEHYLNSRPISARAPSWRYRLQRLLTRHPYASGLTVALLLAILGGVGATGWQMREALHQRDQARAEAEKSRQLIRFLTGVFSDANPTKVQGETVTARALLDAASERIARELPERDSVRADLLAAMAGAYGGLAMREPQLRLSLDALEIERELDRPQILAKRMVLAAGSMRELGDAEGAMALLREAEARMRADPTSNPSELGELLYVKALTHYSLRDAAASELALEQALEVLRGTSDDDGRRAETVQLMLARRWAAGDKLDAAIALTRDLVARIRTADPPRPISLVEALDALGGAYRKAGATNDQIAAYREAYTLSLTVYGAEHLTTAILSHNLALALEQGGDPAAGLEYSRRALEIAAHNVPNEHKFVIAAHLEYLRLRCASGDRAIADSDWSRAEAGAQRFEQYQQQLQAARERCE